MMENEITKTWEIQESVLGYKNAGNLIIPSANDIYAAVFENNFSDTINENDATILKSELNFSKYPVELNIVLQSTDQQRFSIELIIQAKTSNDHANIVSVKNKADPIIIKNTWYPFSLGSLHEIIQILKSVGVSEPGKIRLGQYLLFLKLDSELIRNEVQFLNPFLIDNLINEKPLNLKADLYPYQTKGWQWLRFMKQEKIGGILADEMGLGKTL